MYIYEHKFVSSVQIAKRTNHESRKGGEDAATLNKYREVKGLGRYSNVLCNDVLCGSGKDTSFVTQRGKLASDHMENVVDGDDDGDGDGDDDDDDDGDLEEVDKEDGSIGDLSTDAGDEEEEYDDDNEDNSVNSNREEKAEEGEDYAEGNGEGERMKKHLKFENVEKLINEKKDETKKKFKRYNFGDGEAADSNENSPGRSNASNSEDGHNEESVLNNEHVMRDGMTVFPGLYFVGIGYNLIFGNPLGEPDSLTDPGYRAQIYILNWEISNRGIANDLATLQPLNAWIRKENACSRAESINECSSVSDYTKNLAIEASVSGSYMGLGAFSASSGYNKFLNEISKRTSKTYLVKSNCVKEKTIAYMNAVDDLPRDFTGLDKDSECTSDTYEQKKATDDCKDVHSWMQFFQTYGTHIITEAQLGGKITKIIKVSNSSVSKMQKEGVSVKATIKAQFGFASVGGSTGVSSDSASKNNDESYDMSEQLVVIGGNPIKDVTKEENLYEWSKSVTKNPMPINIKLIPISSSFESEELKNSYEKALHYYTRVYGSSPHDTMQKDEKDILTVLTQSSTITKSGPPPVSAECPHGQVVLFGWVLRQNFWDDTSKQKGYDIEICESGLSSCTSKQGNTHTYDISYIFVECGAQAMPFSEQVVSVSQTTYNTIKCPNDYSIVFGFGVSTSSGKSKSALYTYVTPCRPGMKSCSLNMNNQDDKSFMYIVCVDGTIWSGLNMITMVAKDDFHSAVNRSKQYNDGELALECPSEGTVLTGFYGETHTSSPYVNAPFGKCSKSLKSCSVHGSGQAIGHQNYRSLILALLCKNGG
ncbi:perforin-like protein 1 [Plasmodium ovale]|uniref:Perforin-like protein 1 n=1 Tax=Plasmodium ovale TaxID=36330 RepID=A0A1C3KN81_PLAOA|nr:perforin-like protein 1 [Plasmodium ovale]